MFTRQTHYIERLEKLCGTSGHESQFGTGLKYLKTLPTPFLNLLSCGSGAAEVFSMTLGGHHNALNSGLDFRYILLTTAT